MSCSRQRIIFHQRFLQYVDFNFEQLLPVQQATSLAVHMVKEFGMSERVGLRYYEKSEGSLVVVNENSPQTSEMIDAEVNRMLRVSTAP